jgi:ATP-dependent DNA helicase RecG
MAPTEILAEQHFRKLVAGWSRWAVRVAWLTGSQKARRARDAAGAVAAGEARWWWARTR